MRLSIVVPVHNEAENLPAFLRAFLDALDTATREHLHEVLLVENGSRDGTLEVATRLASEFAGLVRVLQYSRGSYGESIRLGMLEATGTHVCILEVDFMKPEFVRQSLELFASKGARFIVASKRHRDSVDGRGVKRRVLTFGFNLILKVALGFRGTDTHGLKAIEAAWARELCAKAVTTDEVLQTELVLLSWRLGVPVMEVPISIEESRPTPISVRRRLPKVANLVGELRRSLARFPREGRPT